MTKPAEVRADIARARSVLDHALTAESFPGDPASLMDARDEPEFEREWLRVYDSAHAKRAAIKLRPEDAKALDDFAEFAFKRTYKLTQDDDLAAQVSDDALLIGAAILSGFEDEWLNALWLAYRNGSFPHEPLTPVGGALRCLIGPSAPSRPLKKFAAKKKPARKKPAARTKPNPMNWDSIQARLLPSGVPRSYMEDRLSACEQAMGFRLPESYRSFVAHLGLGRLCNLFYVWMPGCEFEPFCLEAASPKRKAARIDGAIRRRFWRSGQVDLQLLRSLIPFGSTDNGDTLCWLRSKDTPAEEAREFPIYLLDSEYQLAPLVASDLLDFVANFLLRDGIDKKFPRGAGSRWRLPKRFVPMVATPDGPIPALGGEAKAARLPREPRGDTAKRKPAKKKPAKTKKSASKRKTQKR